MFGYNQSEWVRENSGTRYSTPVWFSLKYLSRAFASALVQQTALCAEDVQPDTGKNVRKVKNSLYRNEECLHK
ncbi:hypothetical protein FJU30_24950 [Affinibrenneria salicis]|uniref:Uncharacterized protein n=1 Tax=Affinibrenneria salicis TaxID=2590031 RepID=A0A5J5FQG8_9GAMM|nr:hypothetical protein [Affinibrenneria salicis]KAA8995264.1 hypothetical protein FJU30_24950 [Affinibrenneria salicis]